jgi:DNA-binding Lrp family transcriptional regulator
MELDALDRRLITALRRDPLASVSELARVVGVARATVQSRLRQLERRRAITGYGPDVDPAAAGYAVVAFVILEIAQGSHTSTVGELSAIPELLEIHTITGPGDLLCRVVARSNDHLHEILQRVVAITTVTRSQTQLALSTQRSRTVADLIAGR